MKNSSLGNVEVENLAFDRFMKSEEKKISVSHLIKMFHII